MDQNVHPVTEAAAKYMDDMADWAASNVVHFKTALMPARQNAETFKDKCLAVHQSADFERGARGLEAARLTANQARQWDLLRRAAFLRDEASLMLDAQWKLYGAEQLMQENYRASRNNPRDVSACMSCWIEWDTDGHRLYEMLMHRADFLDSDARAIPS